jgi:hypothetical protein
MKRMTLGHMMAVVLLVTGMGHSFAHPTGSHVAADSGSFNTMGEFTKFVQPSGAGAALTHHDKFVRQFFSNNLHFTGGSPSGVQHLGTINALGGDVYLIGKMDNKQGMIDARHSAGGSASGDDVLLNPCGQDHVFVNPSPTACATSGSTAIHNKGAIIAAGFELKAAHENLFALAINHEGTFRATAVAHHDGRTFLTIGPGSIENAFFAENLGRDDHHGYDDHYGYDDHHDHRHDRRDCSGPTNVTPTSKNFFIDQSVISFEASGFNHLSSHSQFYISDPGAPPHDAVSVNTLTGGALNDGNGHNLAAGSSTSGAPGPKRLVTPGNGIWNIFSGTVHSAPPPAFITRQLQFYLSPEVLAHLHEILFGNP